MLHRNMEMTDSENLKKVFTKVVGILEKTGFRVEHEEVRKRLEAYGANVSHSDGCVRMSENVQLKTLALYGKHQAQRIQENSFPEKFSASMGDGCFFIHDFKGNTRRKATENDFIDIVRFANAAHCIDSLDAPVEIDGVPTSVMVVRMLMLLYLNTALPCGVENNIPEQVPYLAALRDIYNNYHDNPNRLCNAQGVTSPLIFGERAGRLLFEGMKYDFAHGIYTMTIAGGNGPVTVEGCAVQAAAELLGMMTCIAACDPEKLASILVLTGTMDMRTGKARFGSSGAIRQNMLVSEMFRRLHGVEVSSNWPWYTDALVPGFQCALERQRKQILYTAHSGIPVYHVGDLDGASTFSPEQAVIDLDVSQGVWEFFKPLQFDEESFAVAEIEAVGAEHGKTHLDSDFTLDNFRSTLWSPRVMPRGYWSEGIGGVCEADVLEAAHAYYNEKLRSYEPEPLPDGLERDIEKTYAKAFDDLKGLKDT